MYMFISYVSIEDNIPFHVTFKDNKVTWITYYINRHTQQCGSNNQHLLWKHNL